MQNFSLGEIRPCSRECREGTAPQRVKNSFAWAPRHNYRGLYTRRRVVARTNEGRALGKSPQKEKRRRRRRRLRRDNWGQSASADRPRKKRGSPMPTTTKGALNIHRKIVYYALWSHGRRRRRRKRHRSPSPLLPLGSKAERRKGNLFTPPSLTRAVVNCGFPQSHRP